MDKAQIERVRAAFDEVAVPEMPYWFYSCLWTRYPSSRAFFSRDMRIQRERLVKALQWTMDNLDRLDVLVPRLKNLGRNHATRYKVQPHHYDWVGEALIATFQHFLAPEGLWTAGLERDLVEVYTVAADVMIQGAAEGYGEIVITRDAKAVSFRRASILRPGAGYQKDDVDEYVSILTGMVEQATTDYAACLHQLEEADKEIARLHNYVRHSDLKPDGTASGSIDDASVDQLITAQKAIEGNNGR